MYLKKLERAERSCSKRLLHSKSLWRGCGLWPTAEEGWHGELLGRRRGVAEQVFVVTLLMFQ